MFKAKKQLKSIHDTKFVSDISSEAAANCTGGGPATPDIIVFEDGDLQGEATGFNSAPGEGISNLGNFNDRISSATINRGEWQFFFDEDFGGSSSPVFGPGDLPVVPLAANDQTSSLRRVA